MYVVCFEVSLIGRETGRLDSVEQDGQEGFAIEQTGDEDGELEGAFRGHTTLWLLSATGAGRDVADGSAGE